MLGLFNPQGDNEARALPLSETSEWPLIRHCFGDRAKALFRGDATVDALLNEAPAHQYVHFSCHGTFDPAKPDLSGLLLASNQRLDVRRIVGALRLPLCRMVATAACETALTATGRLSGEQIGVPAAFLQTGAAAVVATLWPVIDRSTARVMSRTYELHLDHRMRPAQALRQAMLDLRHGRLVDVSQNSVLEENVTFRHEQAQRRSQKEQDGSEIRSVELERLIAEGMTLIERRDSMEFFRDQAADEFERHTGSDWRPRSGSMVNHRTLTSAMIDSRDFLAARRRADNDVLLPAGPKVAFTGGLDFNDHHLIWDALDKVLGKHPDMVLLHGGSPKGAERIAARWADHRKVPQTAFKPGWTRHAKAAPFKRNDQLLDVLPIGVMVFPGTGIQGNLADKAKKLGIPVWFGTGGA